MYFTPKKVSHSRAFSSLAASYHMAFVTRYRREESSREDLRVCPKVIDIYTETFKNTDTSFQMAHHTNSCIIRPWATSRKALKALETSIHCLHRTTHKQPKYATSSRVGITAKVVTFLMFTVTAVLCVWKRSYSQHWVWYWWLTVKLRASILFEVSKLTLFFPIQSQKLQL